MKCAVRTPFLCEIPTFSDSFSRGSCLCVQLQDICSTLPRKLSSRPPIPPAKTPRAETSKSRKLSSAPDKCSAVSLKPATARGRPTTSRRRKYSAWATPTSIACSKACRASMSTKKTDSVCVPTSVCAAQKPSAANASPSWKTGCSLRPRPTPHRPPTTSPTWHACRPWRCSKAAAKCNMAPSPRAAR